MRQKESAVVLKYQPAIIRTSLLHIITLHFKMMSDGSGGQKKIIILAPCVYYLFKNSRSPPAR